MLEITSFEDYFQAIDCELLEKMISDYPKLIAYYRSLKEKIQAVEELDPFQIIQHSLDADAQIQILMEYLRWDMVDIYCEEALIRQIKADSRYYYREKTGLRSTDAIPLGMMYLSDRTTVVKKR